jgi:hypothetical protein
LHRILSGLVGETKKQSQMSVKGVLGMVLDWFKHLWMLTTLKRK